MATSTPASSLPASHGLDQSNFGAFRARIESELLRHPIIDRNAYTRWFEQGDQSPEQIRAFIVQFSVFSNQFLLAQLHKMLNADSLQGMRASKEILANEIGVVFASPRQREGGRPAVDQDIDPEVVATTGSIDGGRFRFRAAHFEWLLHIAEESGLGFGDIGKRRHGTPATLFFCDELVRLYGSEDYTTAQASSFAVENWAAAGFWKQLIQGFRRYNARTGANLPLAFFTWHDRLEAQHAEHTEHELAELYAARPLDEDAFIRHGNEMLDGVAAFWKGLEEQRTSLA